MSDKYDRVMPYEMTKHIIALCPDQYWKKIFMGLYYTGARCSELLEIKRTDIYLDSKDSDFVNIDIVNKKKRKPKGAKRKIKRYRNISIYKKKEPDAFKLFSSLIGDEEIVAFPKYSFDIQDSTFLRMIRRKCNRFFGEHDGVMIAPHFLRHSRASHWMSEFRHSTAELMYLMGWADERMTGVYVHLDKGNIQKSIKRGCD